MEGFGLAIIDIVIHAVKTIIKNLDVKLYFLQLILLKNKTKVNDRLAIIEYHSYAEKVLDLTFMD